MYRQNERQTNRRRDRTTQMERLTDRQADGWIDREKDREKDETYTDRQIDSDFATAQITTDINIYIYAFSRRFYPKRLTIAFRLYIFISMCVPWESNPQPFALLTQCSTTISSCWFSQHCCCGFAAVVGPSLMHTSWGPGASTPSGSERSSLHTSLHCSSFRMLFGSK